MPVNKNALVRYLTIEKCLRRKRYFSLDELVDECTDAINSISPDSGSTRKTVARRTIQHDLKTMREVFNAPIPVGGKFRYEDPQFTIFNNPVLVEDVTVLCQAAAILEQFDLFTLFTEFDAMIERFRNAIGTEKENFGHLIQIDRVDKLAGKEWLDELFRACISKKALRITYHPFTEPQPKDIIMHPFFLKEYNNRWYLIGLDDREKKWYNYALDRIKKVSDAKISFFNTPMKPQKHFEDVIGVTIPEKTELADVILSFTPEQGNYIKTKPLHHSQTLVKESKDEYRIKIRVKPNYELEQTLLMFGEKVKVIEPAALKEKIVSRLNEAIRRYSFS